MLLATSWKNLCHIYSNHHHKFVRKEGGKSSTSVNAQMPQITMQNAHENPL